MASKELVYAIGYNRSYAPWTKMINKKINSRITNISMIINAGKLSFDHWLLKKNKCGGRILGEFCHFVDLSLVMLSHTKLKSVECISRDSFYQDTGKYNLVFEDKSIVSIDYRHDMSPKLPKELIKVEVGNTNFTNNNWKKFYSNDFFHFNTIRKGKGHLEAIDSFVKRASIKNYSKNNEILEMCFSTFLSIKLQDMDKGDCLNVNESFQKEFISKINTNS